MFCQWMGGLHKLLLIYSNKARTNKYSVLDYLTEPLHMGSRQLLITAVSQMCTTCVELGDRHVSPDVKLQWTRMASEEQPRFGSIQ